MFARIFHALSLSLGKLFFLRLPALWRGAITHRMAGWLVAALSLGLAILLSFGQLRAVFGFKTLLVIWGGYLGYWIARGVLRDYRPDFFITDYCIRFPDDPGADFEGAEAENIPNAIAFAAALLARALIVAAVVLALALGA